MSASQDQLARESLVKAVAARQALDRARQEHGSAYLRYISDARSAGWGWPRIGSQLGVTEGAVRRYFTQHRQEIGRLT